MPRLLVVDDEPNVLYSIEKSLSSDTLEVAIAQKGQQAIDLVRQLRPDAVVLEHDAVIPVSERPRDAPAQRLAAGEGVWGEADLATDPTRLGEQPRVGHPPADAEEHVRRLRHGEPRRAD